MKTRPSRDDVEGRLSVVPDVGVFSVGELERCDEPVRRYFDAAVAPGTPLARAARLHMRGSIRIAGGWWPFRANELLAPLHGYFWPASVAGGMFRGFDSFEDGAAAMSWKLVGVVPIISARGSDVARSAIGRAAAEAIWVPTGLLPRYGVHWRADDDHHIVADIPIGGDRVILEVTVGDDGLVGSVHLDRWGDPGGTGAFGWWPFGIDVAASRTFPCGITMPATGTGGWFHATDRWSEGRFFRYRIDDLSLVTRS